jgi:predicted negative regulator of RcsB-dependent stress response
VRSYARHQLKQDSFTTSTAETINWARDNRTPVIVTGIIVVVILAMVGGGWAYINYRDAAAKNDLALALQKYKAPVRPAGTPATADMLSYSSAQERDQVTNAEFTRIANKYTFTQTAQLARYFAGLTYRDLGNNTAAMTELQKVSGSRYKEVASLAKMALAQIDHDSGKNMDAIDIYKQLIEHPTVSVGKSTAQLALASQYEAMARPDDARHIYEQMQKEAPASFTAEIAGQKLQTLAKNQ